ncbi:MAG: methyltransferase domain-containing protein [Zoogloea sp.]|nr:methyltransferase domain-containing protein [Zoogloea sp.]MBP7392854.1 methyltransferase domain-containing protein [Zoogloea sp.]
MSSGYKKIEACRISGSTNLLPVLNLGEQALTGVFPASAQQHVETAPLELVWSPDSGLVQLAHSFEPDEMFGDNYGYRSGLNQSMVSHLTTKVAYLERMVQPVAGDVILDIGSNDATTLKAYRTGGLQRIGIDPTARKFQSFYPDDIQLLADFFSAEAYRSLKKDQKARIVTSIAMFYDLDQPIEFARQIESILADDGVWHLEQSYLPAMLKANSYDTICHEHLEYYSLHAIQKIMDAAQLRIVDVTQNDINGGSFAITVARQGNHRIKVNQTVIDWMLEQEVQLGLHTPRPYRDFEERVFRHREDLRRLVRALNTDGKKVLGYGASTKGNVLLQFCGFSSADIPAIAEVNTEKFGRVTPGTHIPIVSESDALAMQPDYFLVLPWHFKDSILRRETDYLHRGGKFIFPFPDIQII